MDLPLTRTNVDTGNALSKTMPQHKKEQSFLAMEFSSSAVKFVRLQETDGTLQLLQANSCSIPTSEDPKMQDEFWEQAARQLLLHEKLGNQNLILSVNSLHACFSQFVIPKIPRKELKETLKWKMKNEIPFPIEEAVLDWRLFEMKSEEKNRQFSALVSALPQELLERFMRHLPKHISKSTVPASAAYSIEGMPNTFSISQHRLVVVVDIGHLITEIAFYKDGKLSFLRKIAFGGNVLNQCLSQSLTSEQGRMALTLEESEQAKRQENLFDPANQKMIAGKIEVSKLYPLIRQELEKLSGEITRSLDYYAQEHGQKANIIFITGGTSRMKGLREFLAQNLEIPVEPISLARDLKVLKTIPESELDLYYRLISVVLDRKNAPVEHFSAIEKVAKSLTLSFSSPKTSAVILAILVALASGMSWRYQQIVHKTQRLKAEIAGLKGGFGEAQKIQALEDQVNQGKILTSAILTKEPYWEEAFRELAHAFPKNVILTDVSYDQNSFILTGTVPRSGSETSVSDLLLSLEGPIFRKVTLINTEQKSGTLTFTIRCEVL
ncbi:MAG: hypothetical protein A3A81_03175 [Omnitrophica bacterium RIFCSPLOWO2_01_FULL_45_10b]|nr:MAG: hypothetical protein A3A81_03175 [Omnitrophica bacterium RIFCSPLOWO2_01_FULL_45_10b]